jgi:[ribosomal protein S18]-alanine N-acetyltransferase
VRLRGAWPHESDDLSRVHGLAFAPAWSGVEIARLIEGPGGFALVVEDERPLGFILCRSGGGEAEILTLAVDPAARRRGFGKALVQAAAGAAKIAGAEALFLEVGFDNPAALALYRSAGFDQAGVRRGYYDRGDGTRVDAVVMRLDLGAAGA